MHKFSFKPGYYFLTILFCLALIKNGNAQDVSPKEVVNINVKTEPYYSKDKIIEVELNLFIKDGWHINANKPLDDYLTPTVVSLKDTTNIKVTGVKYPVPLLKKLSFSDVQLALYENEASIKLELKIKKGFKKSFLKVLGELQYQPCNNQTCLFPVFKPFSIELRLKK